MSSPAADKKCGVCSGSLTSQAIFTAECSHSFHFGCITNTFANTNPIPVCPLCHTIWNQLPFSTFSMPTPNHNVFHNNTYTAPFQNRPYEVPYYHQPEPLQFSDDDPLLSSDPSSSVASLQKVTIKAIPERPALAVLESVSLFTVLLKLMAPPLTADARSSQRAPIDLVTVLDVSGSMAGTKLDLLKQAVHFVIDNLGPSDRLSIVSFSNQARRILRLCRMTDSGREDAKRAVNSLSARGGTNIVQGLEKGSQVIKERHYKNPVTSIIFLSDGNDNANGRQYFHLLPPSIYPKNRQPQQDIETIPVHSFGFGSDHDPATMHAISDASGGTFSYIESYEMVQDAFASCIGGLLSVVTQGLRLKLRSASHGVEIKSIPSGRYASEITDQGSQGLVSVGDLYADEEKEFLINLSVPSLPPNGDEPERKTSLLDIMCTYMDVVSKETVEIESDLVEIRRVKTVSPSDMTVNLEVDRQRNRLRAAESIAEAQKMAETGDVTGARTLLAKCRTDILGSASGQAGDGMCVWLEADMKETERRMGSTQQYKKEGRAYALSGISSHRVQRATTKGKSVAGAEPTESFSFGGVAGPQSGAAAPLFGGWATPSMAKMVSKSQQLSKKTDDTTTKEK